MPSLFYEPTLAIPGTGSGRMSSALSRRFEPLTPRLAGHQQVTDAYLLGLAVHKKGKLATMDRAILALLPEKSRDLEFVELL
jgi:hypothetical protein